MKIALLNILSSYSFLQSGLTIERIFASAKQNDYYGVAIADNNVLYGYPEFDKAAKKNNVKHIFGLALNLSDRYVVYANNEQGYHNLITLSLLVNQDKLDEENFKRYLSDTTIIIQTNKGEFANKLKEKDDAYFKKLAKLSSLCNHFYLGIEVTTKAEFAFAKEVREFALERGYNTIAFPQVLYQKKDDAIILKIVSAIAKDEKITEKKSSGQQYFQKLEDYQKLYTKQEILNTNQVVDECNFEFIQKRGSIPHYPVENSVASLKELTLQGLKNKGIDDQKHILRAEYELKVISEMGYSDYFLIVSDYVKYARSKGILVGPGRGSAAGSLVSYAIDITEVDPLKYDLQFERFLNKARKTMPDIDIDFMDIRREEMVEYMRNTYGESKVSSIVAFQTIQAKQALRDIGRIYDVPTHHIDMLSKSITDKMTLREAYKKLETFRELVDSDKYFLEIVSLASKIEGLPRQAGQHAAGIILNDKSMEEVLPVTMDLEDHYVSQYEKDYLEEQGFLKFDFLALRNLTTIDICLKMISKNKGVSLDIYHLPYEDENIFKIIANRQTAGIFQLESNGMKGAIKILKPKEFNDVVVLLSLFRPGPMDNIKEYQNRKEGKIKVNYVSKDMEEILSPTYGVIIYQEQISSIANKMAGFSLEEADLFRRAVSHKEKDVLLSAKNDFIKGAIKNGYKENVATKTFEDIAKFANYGFNKSHAVVYAMTACRMAYLKYYYPLEFYTALFMTSSGVNDSKFSEYVTELNKRGLKIFPPDINKSSNNFVVTDGGLLFPLPFIKGISNIISSKIIDERTLRGEYKDFFNFVSRVVPLGINEATISKIIDSGALDSLYNSRATLRNTLKSAIQLASLLHTDDGQIIIDETLENSKQYFVEQDDPLENLSLEYESIGIMLSDNPLRYKKELLKSLHVLSLEESKESEGKISIAGIINYVKTIKTKKNSSTMAFIKLFDETGELEVTIFPKLYVDTYTLLKKNNIVYIKGRYDKKEEKETFIAEEISLLEDK